jgi:hypothetical protein
MSTFFDFEHCLAFCGCVFASFEGPLRRVDIFEEFWMGWRKRVAGNVIHDCAVKERLFRAMDSGVVRLSCVVPWNWIPV